MELTASGLTYLFADRFVRPLSWMGRAAGECAVTVPSTGMLVQVARVEAQCVAVALWSLRQSGFVSITERPGYQQLRNSPWRPGSRLADFDGRHDLRLKKIASPTNRLVGLEGLLLSAVPENAVPLTAIIDSERLDRSLEPIDVLLVPIQEELTGVGAIHLYERKREGRCLSWSKHSQYELEDSKKAELNSQFTIANDLGLFGKGHPGFSRLLRESTHALAAARPGFIDIQQNPVW